MARAKSFCSRVKYSKFKWHKRMPRRSIPRRKLRERCGDRAFLQPGKLKYPVMAAKGPCVLDCDGLQAAYKRAAQLVTTSKRAGLKKEARSHAQLSRKAHAMGRQECCDWAFRTEI